MLYDPKWEKTETRADPLSLESLIAWLEKQPAAEFYCYSDGGHCLAAQYNKFLGRQYRTPAAEIGYWTPSTMPFDLLLEKIAVRMPHTFGAALARASYIAKHDKWPAL